VSATRSDESGTADDALDCVVVQTMYERVGGAGFFERLGVEFYRGVAADEVLSAMYPESPDFEPATRRITLFLIQYWGGPATYMEERGHPRLRRRHFPFQIGLPERDRWLSHMRAAVETVTAELEDGTEIARELMNYFEPTANQMRTDGMAIQHLHRQGNDH
jgi:hemoglobin